MTEYEKSRAFFRLKEQYGIETEEINTVHCGFNLTFNPDGVNEKTFFKALAPYNWMFLGNKVLIYDIKD